jgi:hypothetical protein
MSKSAERISFDPKPLKEGGGWHIVVTIPAVCKSTFLAFGARQKLNNGYQAKDA